jgi:glycosyltransferase involved in cell wall biosynthesis
VRIAYLSADLGVPVFGIKGASIHVRELTRALHALGHEILILTPRTGGDRPPGFDVPVREVPEEDSVEGREQRLRGYASVLRRRALPILREFGPDIIYERYSLFGTAGAYLSRDLGVPHVLEVNAPLSDEEARHRGLECKDGARDVERTVVCSADQVVAVSQGVGRWLRGVGVDRRRLAILPNGVDPDRFRPREAEGARVRAELGLDGRRLVGFVGTLRPWHDVGTLVRALALLDGADRPQLLVVGDGPERARLTAEADRAGVPATFTGAVAHECVPAYLAALDVAVAPYAADETFYFSPLKLVEYLAAARPVAAAAIGEIRHCVRPGETGCLYEPGDTAALAAEIHALLAEPARAAELGAAGRVHVCAEHSWEKNARAVVELAEAAQAVTA